MVIIVLCSPAFQNLLNITPKTESPPTVKRKDPFHTVEKGNIPAGNRKKRQKTQTNKLWQNPMRRSLEISGTGRRTSGLTLHASFQALAASADAPTRFCRPTPKLPPPNAR
jgi:hypothetical protein